MSVDLFAPEILASKAAARSPAMWLGHVWHRLRVRRRRVRRDRYIAALVDALGEARAAARGIDVAPYRSRDWIARGPLVSMAGVDRAG